MPCTELGMAEYMLTIPGTHLLAVDDAPLAAAPDQYPNNGDWSLDLFQLQLEILEGIAADVAARQREQQKQEGEAEAEELLELLELLELVEQ